MVHLLFSVLSGCIQLIRVLAECDVLPDFDRAYKLIMRMFFTKGWFYTRINWLAVSFKFILGGSNCWTIQVICALSPSSFLIAFIVTNGFLHTGSCTVLIWPSTPHEVVQIPFSLELFHCFGHIMVTVGFRHHKHLVMFRQHMVRSTHYKHFIRFAQRVVMQDEFWPSIVSPGGSVYFASAHGQ